MGGLGLVLVGVIDVFGVSIDVMVVWFEWINFVEMWDFELLIFF